MEPPYEQTGPPIPAGFRAAGTASRPRYLLHAGLFLATYASVVYVGLYLVSPTTALTFNDLLPQWPAALLYGTLVMLFLSAHEFGHYIAARIHGVDATLPFFIPFPIPELNPFGTMGAVIRMRGGIASRRVLFDVGVAGPIAGFMMALAFLVIGIVTVPGIESLYAIHPEYRQLSAIPTEGMRFGETLLLAGLRELLAKPGQFFPPMTEIYHYPFLAVGWFGMFVTALNMLPFGQLDGGHVTYAMFGSRQRIIARWFFRFLIFVGLGSVAVLLYSATQTYHPEGWYQFLQSLFGPPLEWVSEHAPWYFTGWSGWLLWALLGRFLFKLEHPPIFDPTPLDPKRMAIGWLALLIFLLSFSYIGIGV